MIKEGRLSKTAFSGNKLTVIIISVAAVALMAIAAVIICALRKPQEMPDPGPFTVPNINVTLSKLQISNFYKENGFISYSENGIVSKKGVDVSYAQKEINWTKVKNAGVDYAMIRAGYRGYESGKLNPDEYFHKNMKGAQKAGLETGVYFFSQAVTEEEAAEEARFVSDLLKDYEITLPVAFDWEPVTHDTARTDDITGDDLCGCALSFCRTIEENGYQPIIYASLNLLREQFDKYDLEQISEYDLWLAEYKDKPEFPYKFTMWQYTDEGKVDGINYDTDINLYYPY